MVSLANPVRRPARTQALLFMPLHVRDRSAIQLNQETRICVFRLNEITPSDWETPWL